MGFKQLLTFALAGILVLETPATAYAAGQSVNIAVAEDSAGHYEMTGMSETEDNLTGEKDAEKSGGGEYIVSDQSGEDDESLREGESGSDSNSSDETGNTGNEEGPSDEAAGDGGGSDSPDESGDTGSGNDFPDESGDTGSGEDSPDESGNTGSEGDSPDETGDIGDKDTSPDGTGEAGDGQGSRNETPEEDTDLDNGTEEEIMDTVSANDLMAAQPDVAAKAGVVTEISYQEASGTGVQAVAPYGIGNAAQYSFTVPADGRYVFYTEEKTSSTGSIYFTVDSPSYSAKITKVFSGNRFLTCKTDFLKQGETVTIQSYAEREADDNCTYTLKVAGQTSLVKGEDGSYSITLPDGENLVIGADEGVRHLRFTAKASSGSWPVDAYYCANDHLSTDASFGSLTATASSTSKPTTDLLKSGRSYDTAYVIYDSSNKFVALYSDILTTKTSETEEGVYIHNAKTDEENSITLDIEILGSNSVYCYYAPEDGSSSKIQSYLYGWRESKFNNLKSGTSYKFEFRNSAGEIYHSVVYTTAGEKISASTTGSSAVISDDFSAMKIKVRPEYNGTADYTYLRYEIVDSLGKAHEASASVPLNDSNKDSDGFFSVDINLIEHGVFLQPGESYQVEFHLDFQQDHIASPPEIITVKAPEQAYVDPGNITFSVNQDETAKDSVNYGIQIADNSSISPSLQACIFYRPSMTQSYQVTWVNIENSTAEGTITSLSVGAAYDFLLYVGGAAKEQTLKLDTASGIELIRVEDAATDYTGPYDIVRTYKMATAEGAEELTGSYYLKLQYQNENGSYSDIGSSIELNAGNAYQATVSSIERSSTLLQPDTDHTLRWMLGKTSSFSEGSAEYCVYETMHTPKAKIALKAGDNGCNYQTCTVQLDAGDVVNFLVNRRHMYFYVYIKKESEAEYVRTDSRYNLNSDNSYGYTLTLRSLEPDTHYELSLRDSSGRIEYEKTAFTTSADQRALSVTSADSFIGSATINYSLSGFGEQTADYILCYYREWTENNSGIWKRGDYQEAKSTYSMVLTIRNLKESSVYEYMIGIGASPGTVVSNLVSPVKGSFTTRADERQIKITSEKIMVTTARIEYALHNMEFAGNGYLIGYIRKKTDMAAVWNQCFWERISTQDTSGTVYASGLEEQTEYELAVGFGNGSYDGKEDLQHIQTVTFTTLADQRRLSDPEAPVKGTNAALSVHFEGNIEYIHTYVHFFYRVKGAAEYIKAERVINVSKIKEKECSITLTGLSKGAVYEFAAVLSEKYDKCDRPDDVTRAEFRTDPFEFTIGAGNSVSINPTSIKLSQTNLYLNANEAYRNSRGSGYENLKATLSPASATSGIRWSSSDESVATVSSGRVTAVAPGTATITAETGAEGNAVSAACEVIVSNYQLARKNDTGMELLSNPGMNASKGGQYIGYTVCRVDNDAQTETAFKVTSNNETVASWDESVGAVIANSTGVTDLVFETVEDHVKLYLTVTVSSAPGKGFTVTGFTASAGYETYAAVQNGENAYTLAYTPGISYHAEGEIIPKNPQFSAGDFNWTTDKADVAVVDERGNVIPLKAGVAVLTITPKEAGEAPYTNETCTVTLHIQSLASADLENATPVYALADISSTIGDVKFPDEEAWKGWEWKEPTTPLVINGVNRKSYPFEAVYKGEDHYPEETTVNVYIAKITGISAYEDAEPGHNQVVEVGSVDGENNPTADSDSITLTVEPLCYGSLNVEEATKYFCDVNVDAPAGVVVKKNDSGTFTVTATRKGTYTLTPVIKVKDKNNSNEKVLAKTSYKIKAVEEEQAYIRLTLEEPVSDGLKLEDGRIIVDYDKKDEVTSFKVIAKLADRNQLNAENFSATKLVWSITDKKVATVTASADTKSAEVKLVGEGHTILTAKVKDAAGHKADLKVEIQNHKPRADRSSVQVNLAYDFDTPQGRQLAVSSSGAVDLAPVYGEKIQSVNLYEDEKAETFSSGLRVINVNDYQWVICPTAGAKTGEGSYYLGVKTTFRDELYVYPLNVKVIEQQATVTAKSVRQANLFYHSDPGSLDIGIKGSPYGITSVRWTDNSAGYDNGFDSEGTPNYSLDDYTKRTKNTERYYFPQQDIQLTANKKLADPGIVSGTLEVQLTGYKKPNVVNTSLKWNYKKPVVNTVNTSTTLIPEVYGKQSGFFRLYNKTEAMYLNYRGDSYSGNYMTYNPKGSYNELICSSKDVKFTSVGSTNYSYTGDKTSGSEKFTVTLNGDDWREPLTAVHTIKLAAPKPYLSLTKLTMNTNRVGSMYTYVRLKNAYSDILSCADIVIKGKDAKSQKLLDDDLLEIRQGESDKSQIVITENRASTMKQSAIANGSYSFTVVPCYLDANGNRISSKALRLKINVTDKEITARTKMSRSLDLTKAVDDSRINGNYIRLDTTFQNIGSSYEVEGSELVGEYSEYFNLRYNNRRSDQRLTIANESELKAGQKYKLSIRFTLRMSNGDSFTVTGAPFTVKPKQTSAKIKVYSNNQTLYAAADTVGRNYGLQVTNSDYKILSAEGSLDCNKDGRSDIIVSTNGSFSSNYRSVTVQLADRDGVLTVTGVKGKTYTIPVTVKLKGRDGITKDVKTSIKVTVKR